MVLTRRGCLGNIRNTLRVARSYCLAAKVACRKDGALAGKESFDKSFKISLDR
jgi:hypothetical protein